MTPKERAEKIAGRLWIFHKITIDFEGKREIAAQIEAAEREAYQNAISKCAVDEASRDKGYAEGFHAGEDNGYKEGLRYGWNNAREKAKGIADKQKCPKWICSCCHIIAQRIGEMEP